MSSSQSPALLPPLKVHETTFLASIWAVTAIALPFVAFRLYVRLRVFRRLSADDVFVVLAYILLLAFACFWQAYAKDLYTVFDVAAGLKAPGADFNTRVKRYLNGEVFTIFMYGFSLWFIKLAFMLFFRRLEYQVRRQALLWWSVLAFNVATFIIWMGITNWRCITVSAVKAQATCNDAKTEKFSQMSLKVQTSMDVLSDVSIMIIPASLLWKVSIQLKKKLVLGGIFSLSVFIIGASISRVTVVSATKANDRSWYYVGSAIEMAIAIIVACLSSYRALFTPNTISQRLPKYHGEVRNDPERHALKRFGFTNLGRSSASIPDATRNNDGKWSAPVKAVGQKYEGHTAEASRATDVTALPPMDRQVYVQSEISVHHPETPKPVAVRGVV